LVLRSSRQPRRAEARFQGRAVPLHPAGGGEWWGLLGVSSQEASGPKEVRLRAEYAWSRSLEAAADFRVASGGYPTMTLKLNREKRKLLARIREDDDALRAVYAGPGEPTKLWSGRFLLPAEGRFTSGYGARRAYGDGIVLPHSGLDIANVEGTPVRASNRGRVARTGRLDTLGNFVVLDHGRGVFSYYLHMRDVAVMEGRPAEKGEVLGSMGAEGVATGPHVHWSVAVAGERVDPLEWTERDFE
jgi:murein DD-endopeptidase MepM/ murein hydrolase activator NlpD